jgi:EAL domain-containing protein (putative c-di-GMP-specific phosphodiesterase class I)/AmiR/NasT family two-component response regulator
MDRLIVIDDEAAFGEFVGKVAAAAGYAPTVTGSAGEFRRALDDQPPAVIVMDLHMPEVDGFELLRELSDKESKAKLIVVSGMADPRTLETASRFGREMGLTMAGALAKPVRVADLKAVLLGLRESEEVVTAEGLRQAIAADRLFLEYQPKIDIRTRKLVGVEALVRWHGHNGGVIMPDAFIPLAESSGLIDDLTYWTVDRAFRQRRAWLNRGLDLGIAVNISAKNIHDHRMPDLFGDKCREIGIPSGGITIELTETASTWDVATLMEVLGRFRIKGFHLALDDFGTGYSAIAQLVKLPFSELKVDKSFVSEMDRARDAAIVVKAIIDVGHNLGLSVVAEGVESETQLKMLAGYGCDIAQGFYFFRPMEAGRIEALAGMFDQGPVPGKKAP